MDGGGGAGDARVEVVEDGGDREESEGKEGSDDDEGAIHWGVRLPGGDFVRMKYDWGVRRGRGSAIVGGCQG